MGGCRVTGWRAALLAVPLLGSCLAPFVESSPQDEQLRRLAQSLADRPLGGGQARVMLQAARRLGLGATQRLAEAGVRVHLDAPFEEQQGLSAVYYPSRKTVSLGARRQSADTLVHELGHALDDLAAPDSQDGPVLGSQADSRLQGLYEDYVRRVEAAPGWQRSLERGAVWSDYATTSPQEYLAEGIMQASRNPRSEARLLQQDPGLLGYVRDLMNGEGQQP